MVEQPDRGDMGSFFAELKRRNVFKVGVAYAIVAWLIAQVIDVINEPLHLPDWFGTVVIVLLGIGFLLALFLAWVYELTPEGIKVTTSEGPAPFHTQATGQRLNYFISGVLALVIVFLVVDNYVLKEDRSQISEVRSKQGKAATDDQEKTDTAQETASNILPNSVAVLPFKNMSPDENNAYFAEGLHEEILNQLAKLSRMTVIARTTMSQYANTSKPIQQIADELNVKTIMEGSVRYADGHIRVTAQLIDPATGGHLWSDTYDHEFKNIFAIESDIAMNVANAMLVEFSLQEQQNIEKVPTSSYEAYSLYLESVALSHQEFGAIPLSIEKINQALAIDPDFVDGWAQKARAHGLGLIWLSQDFNFHLKEGELAADRALALDPANLEANRWHARFLFDNGYIEKAYLAHDKAIDMGAEGAPVFLMSLGYQHRAKEISERLRLKDPLDSGNYIMLMAQNETLGNTQAMLDIYDFGRKLFLPVWRAGGFAMLGHYLGQKDLASLQAMAADETAGILPFERQMISGLNDTEVFISELNSNLENITQNPLNSIVVSVFASYTNDVGLTWRLLRSAIEKWPSQTYHAWRPGFRDVRQTDEFKDYLREKGFVDFWKKYGWPDLCKPVGEDDFECD